MRTRSDNRPLNPRRQGQTIIFLLMALTVLVFIFLWNVDLHRIVAAKSLSQNAGDAAALAAARWQGATLNLVGELNLMHALALSAQDSAAVGAITNLQARLCFTGPLTALIAAQVAAKNNRIYSREAFTQLLRAHADEVARYDAIVANATLFPEPYPGAWDEYAGMLSAIAADGVAAAPDNARFFGDASGSHILRDPAFYDAVAGRIWCWFFLHHATRRDPPRTILDDFTDHTWWPALPSPNPPSFENSEIFGVGLVSHAVALERLVDREALLAGAAQQQIDFDGYLETNVMPVVENWYFYHPSFWTSWDIMHPDGPEAFPVVGDVKPEYDYTGADAIVRLYAAAARLAPAASSRGMPHDDILWTAAAKPFGYLESDDDDLRLRPDAYGIVLPAFREVRLIPIDAASGGAGGAFDIAWRRHIDEHLPLYTSTGTLDPDCRYCRLIGTFEDAAFRRQGIDWLLVNSDRCTLPSPGSGGSRGGGTRRGH